MIWILTALLHFSPAHADHKIEVQGHRGARWSRPENTLPAFQFALEAGVDTLEMDMHVTKDNIIVITHDPYLNTDVCADKNGNHIDKRILVRSLTLKELQEFDCGAFRNPKFAEQKSVPKTKVPTLEQVFRLVKNSEIPAAKKVQFNIETKSEAEHPEFTPNPDEFVKMFLDLVRKEKLLNRVVLQSFDYRTLKIAHRLEPKLRLSVLVEDRPKDLMKLMQENQAQILSPNFEWLTEKDVQDMHKIGARVIPWTPNQPADWKRLLSMGVDGIITDNPQGLLHIL